MKTIQIKDSYKIWHPTKIKVLCQNKCKEKYGTVFVTNTLNRYYYSFVIEWWLHNIGYYMTKPFCFINSILKLNLRFKDVDLEEHQVKD